MGPPATIMATADLAPPLVQVARLLDWTPVPLTIKDGLRFSRRMEIPPRDYVRAGVAATG
ncbi:MAG: hypothetical protein H6644_19330 [Caldilineaceae bacterium]|nr:hypothetical protein [Caldilineaceae bacterium]